MLYNKETFELKKPEFKPTLQFFITNRCNKACKACFYADYLHKDPTGIYDMDLYYYIERIHQYKSQGVKKIILIGGEPTLHKDIQKMIEFNRALNLDTTIYTNGTNLEPLMDMVGPDLSIRVGVLGYSGREKNLADIKSKYLPIMIVYMLRPDNVIQLPLAVKAAEQNHNCTGFMISTIRDLVKTGNFFTNTEDTISNAAYRQIIQHFFTGYAEHAEGIPEWHICGRTVIGSEQGWNKCRYLNFHVDGSKTICPWDISMGIRDGEGYELCSRTCNKHSECILQKIVLKRKAETNYGQN
ncbi:MAG: radical SAM protein [Actinomycetia bacterium]|nr:radical SAM protein [Actinomycetes bacterium]